MTYMNTMAQSKTHHLFRMINFNLEMARNPKTKDKEVVPNLGNLLTNFGKRVPRQKTECPIRVLISGERP